MDLKFFKTPLGLLAIIASLYLAVGISYPQRVSAADAIKNLQTVDQEQLNRMEKIVDGLNTNSGGGGGTGTATNLVNAASVVTANGDLRQLFTQYSGVIPSLDWDNRQLIDSGGIVVYDWQNFIWRDGSGVLVLDGGQRFGYDAAGDVSIDFDSKFLRGLWTASSGLTVSSNFVVESFWNAAGATNLNASALASGTIPDARLSLAVVLTNGNQTISGQKTWTDIGTFLDQLIASNITSRTSIASTNDITSITGNIIVGSATGAHGFSTPSAFVGNHITTATRAIFGHVALTNDPTAYAIGQNSLGTTLLNASTNHTIQIRIGNVVKSEFNSNGWLAINGTAASQELDVTGSGAVSSNFTAGVSMSAPVVTNSAGGSVVRTSVTTNEFGTIMWHGIGTTSASGVTAVSPTNSAGVPIFSVIYSIQATPSLNTATAVAVPFTAVKSPGVNNTNITLNTMTGRTLAALGDTVVFSGAGITNYVYILGR